MTAWLVRRDDALDDVKRTLSEAIREYGLKNAEERQLPEKSHAAAFSTASRHGETTRGGK